MQEFANKVLESKDTDAEIRKSSISRISVEGYDTSLRWGDVDDALREHFASYVNLIYVYVPKNVESGILCRYSLIYVNEEDEEKALRLDGSDMGGRTLQINPYPFHENHLDHDYFAPMKEGRGQRRQHTPARVYVFGHEGVEKALELSGRSLGGLNFVVILVDPLPKIKRRIGYIRPNNFTISTKEQFENPTTAGNQKKKKRRNQNKKKEKKTGNQKKKSEPRYGNQKMKGVEISF